MRIADLKTHVVENPPPHHGGPYWVFLKLTTADNIEGFGEVYGVPFSPHKVTQLIEDVVERHVVGWDSFNIELLWRTIHSRGYTQHPDLTTQGVLSGIEIACWDIVGKALGQPIYNLLGGQVREKLRSYTSCMPHRKLSSRRVGGRPASIPIRRSHPSERYPPRKATGAVRPALV